MFASSQAYRYLGTATLVEINTQRYKGKPALLSLPKQSPDLTFMEEELPAMLGIISPIAALTILADMNIIEEHLTVFHPCVTILKTDFAFSEGLHLHALQHNTGFIGIDNVVIVPRPSICCNISNSTSQFPANPWFKFAILHLDSGYNYTTDLVISQASSRN